MNRHFHPRLAIAMSVILAIAGLTAAFADQPASAGKIASQVLLDTADGRQASFIVYMSQQADLSGARLIKDADARGVYVYLKLKEQAEVSQAAIKALLTTAGVSYQSFWAANMVVVEGNRELVDTLAARPDVKAIEPNSVVTAVQDIGAPDDIEDVDDQDATDVIETGITQAQAPSLWNLGFRGEGIVVANQDTGMRWTHAVLRTKYRGWGGSIATSDHNYNWWDSVHARITSADGGTASPLNNPCGRNLQAPCDDNNHGTHTTGTVVGDDAGAGVGTGTNQVGVAPGARWIGCRNMDSGNGRASTYTECFQFFLAPTDLAGANPDPARRPHVMNNSWGCPQAGELCAPNVMKTIVENAEAAGIFIVASNGNDGPGCSTALDPPGIYETTFSIGSISSTNALSSFSSRGPVATDGSGRMKPDMVARGATVRSSFRSTDTTYGSSSGTSMASPHVVGSVALLWSARPRLVRDTARTKWLLTRSANPNVTVPNNAAGCNGTGSIPNNHFGWGRLDVLAAYTLETTLYQTIDFATLAGKSVDDPAFTLESSASSGLPVHYSAAGACSVSGQTVQILGPGGCTITASQEGLDEYSIAPTALRPWYPADDVSRSFNIQYPYSGFFAPIENTKLNAAQAGNVVPIKFSLGGNRGTDILASGYPRSARVACPGGGSATDVNVTSPAGKSGLRYDQLAGQYVYAWQSEKSWAGTCRQLELKLIDNTVHTATFQYR